jgi:hypothetical protein
MKTGRLSLGLACLILGFCAQAPYEKIWTAASYRSGPEKPTQQTFSIADLTYDRVWEACERSLVRSGFEFFVADRASGEIRVRSAKKTEIQLGDASRSPIQPLSEGEFLILLSKDNGKISVTVFCTYYRDDSLEDVAALRAEKRPG